MLHASHNNRPKTTKFDVLMLSEADIAFLNNEAPRSFDEEASFDPLDTPPAGEASGSQPHFRDLSATEVENLTKPAFRQTEIASPAMYFHQTPAEPDPMFDAESFSINLHDEHINPFEAETANDMDVSIPMPAAATMVFKPPRIFDNNNIKEVITHIILNEPLLTEDDLLFLVKKEYTGSGSLSRKTLRHALKALRLSTEYQRFQAYITG